MNLILGINAGHDSAVCLISNGEIVYAIEEEKISRIKQDIGSVSYTHLTLPTKA